jgi:hypothetical protein
MALDEAAHRRPEPVDQPAHEEEPQAPGGDAGDDEGHEVEARDPAGDGDDLEGKGGEAGEEHDGRAVLVVAQGEDSSNFSVKP